MPIGHPKVPWAPKGLEEQGGVLRRTHGTVVRALEAIAIAQFSRIGRIGPLPTMSVGSPQQPRTGNASRANSPGVWHLPTAGVRRHGLGGSGLRRQNQAPVASASPLLNRRPG